MVTLDAVRAEASQHLYPWHVLDGCESALILFAAAWHGKQDAIHIADAGLAATCVDLDHAKLNEMTLAYPEGWEYVHGDAFEYVARTEREWDVVSIDCPTNLFGKCAELLPFWALLALRVIVLGCDNRPLEPPEGWRETERRYRSSFNGGTYWAVFERA